MAFFAKCERCGQFIGFANYVIYSPYGSSQDIDPPEPCFECLMCWDGQEEKWRRRTYNVSYIKPRIIRDGQREYYVPAQ